MIELIPEFSTRLTSACFTAKCEEHERQKDILCDLLNRVKKECPNMEKETKRCINLVIKGLRAEIPDYDGMELATSKVIEKFPCLFQFLPREMQTKSMCESVIEQDADMIEFVAPKYLTYDLCLQSVKKRWLNIAVIPAGMRTGDICAIAEENNKMARKFFPPSVLKS